MIVKYTKASDDERELLGIVYGPEKFGRPGELHPSARFLYQSEGGNFYSFHANHSEWKIVEVAPDSIPCEQRAALLEQALNRS